VNIKDKIIDIFKNKENEVSEYMTTDQYKIAWMKKYYKKNKYKESEINLFGIRDYTDIDKDVINDYIGYWNNNEIVIYRGTTDPSVFYTKNQKERNERGTFHLMEGFHESIWCVGIHKGYEALVNDWRYCRPTKGWRDANYNFTRDPSDIVVYDYFGINLHRMHPTILVPFIGRYSAGCQVINSPKEFQSLLSTIKKTNMYLGTSQKTVFDYTLLNIKELPEGFLG
jgi:hypothetical protein